MKVASSLLISLLHLSLFAGGTALGILGEESSVLNPLRHVLQMIFTHTCAANNLSIFVSTEYRELLELAEKRLVDEMLDNLLHRQSLEAQLPLFLDQKLHNEALNQQVHLMMFFVKNMQQFQWSISGNTGATASHKHKFLVVLFSKSLEQMAQIFAYMLHERMNIDVVVLLTQLDTAGVQSYTYYPYGTAVNPSCESFAPVPLPLGEALLHQLYPQKLHNLHGCPLHAIVWNIPPYVQLHTQRATVREQLLGWDAQLYKLLAQRLNFAISWRANEPPDLVGGEVKLNGTFTGVYRMLRQRRGNLTFGCTACNPARAKYFSNTVSYNQVEYIIVFREGSTYSYYEIMLFPYKCCTWSLLIVFTLLRLLFRLFAHFRLPSPFKIGWIMLLFVLRVGYEGSIFEFVHNAPVRPLPHTWDQALLENYSIIMDEATSRMVASIPSLTEHALVFPGVPVDMFDHLLRQPHDSRIALLTSRDFLFHYLTEHREQRYRFVMLEQKMMNNIICMHFPLGSYLARTISQLLFDLRSFGICQQLTKIPSWASPPLTTSTRNRPLTQAHKGNPFVESMRFLHAAFYCLLYAELLILGIFLLELLSSHRQFPWLNWLFQRL